MNTGNNGKDREKGNMGMVVGRERERGAKGIVVQVVQRILYMGKYSYNTV